MTKTPAKSLKTARALGLCLVLGASLSACGNARMVRGYVFDPELANAIQPGVDNRQSVKATLGTPTVTSTFSDKTWYYVSTIVRVRPVFWPDPKDHRVLAVAFNDKGVVSDVENYDISTMRHINPVKDKTPTYGRSLNFFQQIFGSIGRFSGQAPVGSSDTPGPNG
ncbi:outer membrane protein assembly factor BamE [Kordiimonas marina]|uniref:outer membrane protein assembly factor BamE n=1 Tax=Kordiimonas marina TaxID=2872312 RepID=UPI001FF2CEC4|nr:outer membrane protein assembly factor BamE [Kordiimonas marina]MCJ9430405.1 outer membrane protein assembly factor BamE [Kordiimonas marina]